MQKLEAPTGHTAWLLQACRDHLKLDIFERAHEFDNINEIKLVHMLICYLTVLSMILSIEVLGHNIHLVMSSSSLPWHSLWNKITYLLEHRALLAAVIMSESPHMPKVTFSEDSKPLKQHCMI